MVSVRRMLESKKGNLKQSKALPHMSGSAVRRQLMARFCARSRATTCKTRPAGRVRPATRLCPAREMFLDYNGNRPAA